ncbi:MAG: T9SS type A sorting domain-containing protein [Chitinophagales bacterium]
MKKLLNLSFALSLFFLSSLQRNFAQSDNCETLKISIESQETICGLATGTAEVFTEGGFPPYTYEWNNGVTAASNTQLAEGTYTVLVTDSQNCTVEGSVKIAAQNHVAFDIPAFVCSKDEPVVLELLHEEGIWTGIGVHLEAEGYVFRPIEVESGIAGLMYIVEGCNPLFATIEVTPTPDASFYAPEKLVCLSDGAVTFEVLGVEGGTFFINETPLLGNSWTPTETGTFAVTYEVVNTNFCTDKQTIELQVIDIFNPHWTTSNGLLTICESDLPLQLKSNMMGGSWTTDINSNIVEQDGQVFFNADIENADHGSFSVTYEGGGANCGQAETHVVNVYNVPEAPQVVYEPQVVCASEGMLVEMTGNPKFCNCPVTFNIYAGNGELVYEGETQNNDVADLKAFAENVGTHVFEVVTVNKVCESEAVEVVFEVESVIEVEVESIAPSCEGNDGSLTALASGGSGDYFYSWSNGVTGEENVDLIGGQYNLVVLDSEGCTFTQSFTLAPVNVPVVDLGSSQILAEGQTIVLNAGNTGATFLWSTGATAQTISVSETGVYSVTVTNQQGCSANDSIQIINDTGVGIYAIGGLNEWKLYPNPMQDYLVLEMNLSQKLQLDLVVFDVLGRTIFTQNYLIQNGDNQLFLNTSDWVSGVYWVVLKGEKGNKEMVKLVK